MDWCRTCLSCDKDLVSIYKTCNIKGNEYSIVDIISSITSIRISSDDKYSKVVCNPCVEKAIDAFDFKLTVEESQITFENKHVTKFFDDDLYLIIVENFKKNKNLLTRSQSESSLNEEKSYDCKLCDNTFKTFSELKHHRSKHSKKRINNVEADFAKSISEECSTQTEENFEDMPSFMCDICGIVKNTKILLNAHKQIHNQMDAKRMCTFCGKAFHSERYFFIHMLKHKDSDETELKLFACDDCGLPFDMKEKLKRHIFIKHSNVKKFQCRICSKCFRTKGNLKDHTNSHTKDQMVQCHLCGKKCINKQSLTHHIRLHTGEKPYECSMCHQQFISSSRIKVHMTTKHGEKNEICVVCNRKYYLKTTLNVHMKTHMESNNIPVKMAA